MNTQVKSILEDLRSLANPSTHKIYVKQGVNETILGVNKGPLRKMATKLSPNPSLAFELWESNVYEARIMAIMLFDAKALSFDKIKDLIDSSESTLLIDELTLTIFEEVYPRLDFLDAWKHEQSDLYRRCAWNAAIANVMVKKYSPTQLQALIDVIKDKMLDETPLVQYAMNRCLCEIGIRYDDFTQACIAVGENLGLYKEMKVAKGCTSPYAPNWIEVARYNRTRR